MPPRLIPHLVRVGLLLLAAGGATARAADTAAGTMPERHRDFLAKNCQGCHGAEKQKGRFRVDDLPLALADLPTAERWQKILNALNAGEMPPEDEPQPAPDAKANFLDDLSNTLVAARRRLADQNGVITLRRLNRREYANTLHALLGVHVDVSPLPADTGGPHFDTVGAGLFVNGNQFELYETLALEALEEALRAAAVDSTPRRFRLELETGHPAFLKRNRESLEAIERMKRWMKAVDDAAALPENAALVAKLRQDAPTADDLRFHWHKIPGAPSPMEFGFSKETEVNPRIIYRHREYVDFIRYDDYYLRLPALDRGAYLPVRSNSQPFGFGGTGLATEPRLPIPRDFPPGDYVVRIRAAAAPGAPAERRFLDFGLKGAYVAGPGTPARSTHHVTGTLEAPEVIEIPFTLTRANVEQNHRQLFVRERGFMNLARSQQLFREAVQRNGHGPEVAIWIDWMEIERQPVSPGSLRPGLRALDLPLDDQLAHVPAERLRAALARFAQEAYRGVPPPDGLVDRLLRLHASRRAMGGTTRDALKQALAAVLSSPRFLYRAEPEPDAARRPLDGGELATRLSYFLWGAPPDGALRDLASLGQLQRPEILKAQTDRLLDDPRSAHFVRPFLSQWLTLDRLDLFQFSQTLHPRFDDAVKGAARQEVYETFGALLRDNGRLGELLSADHVVINALLADYYGIPGVTGDAFRKVPLPAGSPRGGLLGMAAIMAMGSNGQHTNPVERGAWVLRKLLHEPPPPAPANVPELARLGGQLLTARERLRKHQEEPQCANCHRKIDPIGFGLENFDAVGQWRTTDTYEARDEQGKALPNARKTWIIDAGGTLHRGPAFRDYFELRAIIAGKQENFARGFASALIEYALGRPCGFSDEPLIASIVAQAGARSFATREFVHALIRSPEFLSK
jgi:cytochrome c553